MRTKEQRLRLLLNMQTCIADCMSDDGASQILINARAAQLHRYRKEFNWSKEGIETEIFESINHEEWESLIGIVAEQIAILCGRL